MKATGSDEWTINYMIELFDVIRKGYLSQVASVVDDVTGKRPITLSQFAKDYSAASHNKEI